MIEIAMQMLFCLLVAAILGGIIGYILGRISKCDVDETRKVPLYDYDEIQQNSTTPHQEVFASIPDATIKKQEKGIKPITLSTPREGVADDLKKIEGIGLKIENGLYELGIFHYTQIAEWSADNITWIDTHFAHQGRIAREEWIAQAQRLSEGGDIPHQKED